MPMTCIYLIPNISDMAVLPIDPEWDYNSAEKWERSILCVKVDFKASWQKAINSKVSAICQGLDKNLTAFLERLREALIKPTNSDLDSYEGQIILKGKFLTQSASDIR